MLQKNVASQSAFFCLVNATTGAAFPGAAITQKRALDTAAQANVTGSTTELGGGQYRFDPSQADTNANFVSYFFTATNAVPVCMNFITISATQVTGVPQVDLATWRATQPNPLISGRVDANTQATASALTFNLTGTVSGSVGSVTSATLVGTNADKTGYSLTQAFPSNFSSLSIDSSGTTLANLVTWRGTQPNLLISGRPDVNAQATAAALTFNLTGTISGSVGSVTSATLVGTNADKTGYSLTQSFPTNFALLSIDASGNAKTQSGVKKNTALPKFEFLMTDGTTHAPVANAGSVGVQRSIDNGAFGSGTITSATVIGFGWYSVDLGAGDLNGTVISLRATGTSCDDMNLTLIPDP